MKLTFLGANRQVSGSRYCLEASGTKLMIDCGMVQEREFQSRNWRACPIPPANFEAVLLTHVHIDHSGLLPKLVREGFKGPIYATPPSVDLIEIILRDAAKIQEEDAKYKKRRHQREGRTAKHPEIPLFTERDVEKTLPLFVPLEYDKPIQITPAFTATFRDAGHILGSASIEVIATEASKTKTFLFSGDVGQWDRPLMKDPTTFAKADFVIMESTYGDRDHKDAGDVEQQMEEIINRTVQRGGNIVIPTFAVERAQELMYHIGRLVYQERIPEVPVFLDSPMAVDVTNVFRQNVQYMDEEARNLTKVLEPPMKLPSYIRLVKSVEDSKAINSVGTPAIIMAASGMCNAGRIKHHLRSNIGRRDCTILFVGYQARGTLGRQILEGHSEVRIHGKIRPVKAEIAQIFGFSGHGDRTDLLQWLGSLKQMPQQIFLTHGEEKASLALAKEIEENFDWPVVVPAYGDSFDINVIDDTVKKTIWVHAGSQTDSLPSQPSNDVAELVNNMTTKADFELLNRKPIESSEFLQRDPWRVFRIQSDVVQGVEMMTRALSGVENSVAVFGSARTAPGNPDYLLATETCRKLGEKGFAIITGGGPGIMEAANRGAREAKTHSIALNIALPEEQMVNPYVDFQYTCHYFFVRKMMFAKYSQGFLIFPGGFGTLDELFESLTLIQTGKLDQFPVILVGSRYWGPMVDWLRSESFHHGFIDSADLNRLRLVDTANEACEVFEALRNSE